ncbi:hypothetical protein [Micromonospora peucetia]|uniref:Uncharacterized protein n=1 Tax=Micromonospora peucetia TaxID=47871 RepID=A0ABZ1E9Y1_9ACTN|nr:hypothetical protein [Micromonospora peucetia]WSA30410.1 hypothetical protein OIE14_19665 [Micromonospora peucetia]
MAKHRASGDVPSTREGVTEGPDTAYWSVDDSRWRAVRPDLPDHMVDLLAPPIVVGVARVPITSRLTPPADLRSTPPADSRSTAPVASAGSRRIVPAGPGAPGRRPAGAATPSGRHRRAAGRPDRTA